VNKEDIRDQWDIWGVAAVVSIAVLAGLCFKGITGESIADGVKDIGAALIPILSAFVAARLITRQMDPSERIFHAGEDALARLQKRHPQRLSGPKANRENYDDKSPENADKYLFIQKEGKGRKAQLVRVPPLRDGVVEIRDPRTTLLILDTSLDAKRPEELSKAQQSMLKKVSDAVETTLKRDWAGTYELLQSKHQDIAIVIDFDEVKLGYKQFGKAVLACAEAAFDALLEATKQDASQGQNAGS